MIRLVCYTLLTITTQITCSSTQDLKSIFHIPSRRNYDDLEILERSNFDASPTPAGATNPATDTPLRAFANAQVMLRFGDNAERGKCACGDVCQCKREPYYVPVLTPLPYCLCAPPTMPNLAPPTPNEHPTYYYIAPPKEEVPYYYVPKPVLAPPTPQEAPQEKNAQNGNVIDENEQPENSEIKHDNHPQILKTVELSEDTIKPAGEDLNKIKCLEEVSNKLEPNEFSPNLKIVSLDLDKVGSKSSKKELQNCLIPYSLPKQKPKLMVTYPIFNRPNEVVVPVKPPVVQCSQSGYSVSGGSGYYVDPVRTMVYRRPTVLSVVPPQTSIVTDGSGGKFIYVPVFQPVSMAAPMTPVPVPHNDDCCCYSCAKYAGELNEKVQAR